MEFKIYGELFALADAQQVAAIDAPQVSTSKEYVEENRFSYYVLINTWLMLVADYTGYAHTYLGQSILTKGLIPVIREAQTSADEVVHGTDISSSLWRNILLDVQSFTHSNRGCEGFNVGEDPMATVLCLMRYPKRFSPLKNDIIQKETLEDFVRTEKRTKELQRIGYPQFVIERVRQEIADLYPWDEICDEIEKRDPSDLRFSSGAGFDTDNKLGSKLRAIAKHPQGCFYFPTPFGVRMLDIPRDQEPPQYNVVKVAAVPKNYKNARIIAMEDTYRLAQAKDIEYIFRRYDKAIQKINLEDQTVNQRFAREGSISGYYATLDASHASDMISKSLFVELFPPRYVHLVTPLLGTHCQIGNTIRRMEMLSTSGHALTFRHETIVYLAIGLAADRLVCNLTGASNPFCWAYGDDTEVPTRSAETAIDFYRALGMKINADKSFYSFDHLYRESCGEEYYKGVRVTSIYYPRFPVLGHIDQNGKLTLDGTAYNDEYRGKLDNSLTMLIDLQKKVFPFSRSSATFLTTVVKKAYPKMTTSSSNTICSDLWGYQDLGQPRTYRAYTIVEDDSIPYASERTASRHFERLKDLPLSQVARTEFDRLRSLDTLHCVPTVTYALDPAQDTSYNRTLWQLYCYQDFLRHGPRYASRLDELLGISEPSPSFASFFGSRKLTLNMR